MLRKADAVLHWLHMIATDFSKRFPMIFTQSVQACAKQAAGEQVQADVTTAKKVGRPLTTDALT